MPSNSLTHLLKILFPAAIFLTGCATTANRVNMGKDIEGFTLPGHSEMEPGMATVYIARPSALASGIRFNVYAENEKRDSLEIGYTRGREHLWFSINPGQHKLISVAENAAEIEAEFKPDSTYFFVQETSPGFFMARNELVRTDSITGTYFVKNTTTGTKFKKRLIVADSLRLGGEGMNPKGIEILVGASVGGVSDGLQKQSGLVTEKGVKAHINKTGVNFSLQYFFHDHLGLQFETGGLWGTAVAPGAKDMDYTNAWSSNLGLICDVFNQSIALGLIRYSFAGGFNYTRLEFAKEFKDFTTSNNPGFFFYDDAASGLGWYMGPELEVVQKRGLLFQFSLRYMEEYPQFPKGTRAFAAGEFLGRFSLGYRF